MGRRVALECLISRSPLLGGSPLLSRGGGHLALCKEAYLPRARIRGIDIPTPELTHRCCKHLHCYFKHPCTHHGTESCLDQALTSTSSHILRGTPSASPPPNNSLLPHIPRTFCTCLTHPAHAALYLTRPVLSPFSHTYPAHAAPCHTRPVHAPLCLTSTHSASASHAPRIQPPAPHAPHTSLPGVQNPH